MSTSHAAGCACRFCAALQAKTMSFEEWTAIHGGHLRRRGGEEFEREPFPHPSGTWSWVVCPCGAKYLTTEDVDV